MEEIHRRPVVGLALAWTAGTCLGLCLPVWAPLLLGATLALIVLSLILHRYMAAAAVASLSLLAAALLVAWLNAGLRTPGPATTTLNLPTDTPLELSVVLADEPSDTAEARSRKPWVLPARAQQVDRADGTPLAFEGPVRLSWPPYLERRTPHYGDLWLVKGTLFEFPATTRPSLSPSIPFIRVTGARFVSEGNGNAWVQTAMAARTISSATLARGIEDRPAALQILNSLLLGYRSQVPRETYQAFAATGTLHIFAISGSHVVVLAAVIIFGLNAGGVSRRYWVLFLAPMLVLYTIMTGLQPSAVRACVMAIIFWIAPLLDRKADIYASMAASALLILAVQPTDVLDLGFILSFAVVLGLTLLYNVFADPLHRLFVADPLRVQPEARWVTWLRARWQWFASLLATSAAAWLVSTPLTAYFFQMFSPIALVGNLIAIPLSALIIVTGSLSLVLGSCSDFLAEVFNHANLALATLMGWTVQWLAAVPGGHFPVETASLPWLLTFYAVLGVWVLSRLGRSEPDPDADHAAPPPSTPTSLPREPTA